MGTIKEGADSKNIKGRVRRDTSYRDNRYSRDNKGRDSRDKRNYKSKDSKDNISGGSKDSKSREDNWQYRRDKKAGTVT